MESSLYDMSLYVKYVFSIVIWPGVFIGRWSPPDDTTDRSEFYRQPFLVNWKRFEWDWRGCTATITSRHPFTRIARLISVKLYCQISLFIKFSKPSCAKFPNLMTSVAQIKSKHFLKHLLHSSSILQSFVSFLSSTSCFLLEALSFEVTHFLTALHD